MPGNSCILSISQLSFRQDSAIISALYPFILTIQEAFMNIIIAGDGKIGSMLTRQLSSEGHYTTVIDSNPKVL